MEHSKIEAAVNEWISSDDLFLVEIRIDRDNRISIFLDSDTGVSIEQCIRLTRFIESRFDREVEDFELTVSSYGLTQALVLDRQLQKYIGKMIEVSPLEGKVFTATLTAFDPSSLTFERTLTKKEIKEGVSSLLIISRAEIRKIQPHITF